MSEFLAFAGAGAIAWGLWRLHRAVRRYSRTDWGSPWLNWLDGLNRFFCLRFHRMEDVRLDLPPGGPAVVVSNHVSGLDPLLLIAAADRPLRFIIAREQYVRPCLHWLFRAVGCIPVDRAGRPERALRDALAALRDGEVVAIFPHGRIHLPSDEPRPIKRGAVFLAAVSACSIYPVRISGITAAGQTVRAVFIRSRVEMEVLPTLKVASGDFNRVTRDLQATLE